MYGHFNRNSSSGALKLTNNSGFDKYKYSGYGNPFDACWSCFLSDGSGLIKT